MKKTILAFTLVATLFGCGSGAVTNEKAISGIVPYDVYKNCEDNGFETEKVRANGATTWINTNQIGDYSYRVETYTEDVSVVESVRATAIVTPNAEIENTKDFMKFASSIPYDGSNPEKVAKWLDENYNNDGAELTVGDVKFHLTANNDLLRVLMISK